MKALFEGSNPKQSTNVVRYSSKDIEEKAHRDVALYSDYRNPPELAY